MSRGDAEWVQDHMSAVADIRADTAGMDFAAFSAKPTTVRSVLYSIAVIGEAAKNITPDFKAAHAGLPWRAITGLRDRIVHEYFRINTRRIRDVVTEDIDALEDALREQPDDPPSVP
jgi:uncharacterized protein with HEPN domain